MSALRRFPGWLRYSGVGLELAGAIGGLALVGYWIDGHYGTGPWGILGGVAIGMVGGLYNLVRESLDAAREARVDDEIASKDAAASTDGRTDGDR
jgi:F0F1-type ATP synthase assembly protein I